MDNNKTRESNSMENSSSYKMTNPNLVLLSYQLIKMLNDTVSAADNNM
jgi:hypothetical protein